MPLAPRPLRRPSMTTWRHVPKMKEASLLGLANRAVAQLLQRHDQHVLHEVRGRRFAAQVPQAVEPDARREAPAKLGLGRGSRAGAQR